MYEGQLRDSQRFRTQLQSRERNGAAAQHPIWGPSASHVHVEPRELIWRIMNHDHDLT